MMMMDYGRYKVKWKAEKDLVGTWKWLRMI